MNDSIEFPTPQAAVDCFADTHARFARNDNFTPPLLLELTTIGRIRFRSEDRPTLEKIWQS
jgi:hypothetical protein